MRINELELNKIYDITLVVKSATARETRAKKPYLAVEFFDGKDIINGNYWDWTSGNIPAVNAIVDVRAQVTEWQGTKQLNIKSMVLNTTKVLADFIPSSDVDISGTYKDAFSLMSEVKDDTLREIALAVLQELQELWITVPGAKQVHHAYVGGTLVHSYSVAKLAGAMANAVGANWDLAVVGGMLHDIGKLFTYKVNGVSIDMTSNGMLYEHIFMGAEFIGNFAETHVDVEDPYVYAKVRLLRHIILSHHGGLEYGSPVTPQCIEAYIVHHADNLDATIEQIRTAGEKAGESRWSDRIYTLNNRPHLTPLYVNEAFASHEETV